MKSFMASSNHGFHMTFSNGWTVSVQFGKDNYCQSKIDDDGRRIGLTAEIAAWNKDYVWFKFAGDEVKGHCLATYVATFIKAVSEADSEATTFPFEE